MCLQFYCSAPALRSAPFRWTVNAVLVGTVCAVFLLRAKMNVTRAPGYECVWCGQEAERNRRCLTTPNVAENCNLRPFSLPHPPGTTVSQQQFHIPRRTCWQAGFAPLCHEYARMDKRFVYIVRHDVVAPAIETINDSTPGQQTQRGSMLLGMCSDFGCMIDVGAM